MWDRGKSGMCNEATKYAAGKEAGTLPTEKGTKAQQHVRHASERRSIEGKRMENQKGDSNVCEVWGM